MNKNRNQLKGDMETNKTSEETNDKPHVTSSLLVKKQNRNDQFYSIGHNRSSSSSENKKELFPSKKTSLILPSALSGFSGTLKSRREQKRISEYLSKTENHETIIRKLHFDDVRGIFENCESQLDHYENKNQISDYRNGTDQNVPTRDTDTVFPESERKHYDIPPRITAMLNKRKNIVRPIAFKPVPCSNKNSPTNSNVSDRLSNNCSEKYSSTPSLMIPPVRKCDRFGSTSELNQHLIYNYSSLPRKSVPIKTYDSLESILTLPDSSTPTQYTRKSSQVSYHELISNEITAPSPSESNISELEAILRERDSELAHLRRTMEHNENVIFKVHQDKERYWELELNRLKAIHENRLQAGAQKVHKLEQLLMMQTFTLRQDKKRLIEKAEFMKEQIEKQHKEIRSIKIAKISLRDQNTDLSEEIQMLRRIVSELKEKLEDVEWNLCQKNREATIFKSELNDVQNETNTKNKEIFELKCIISILNEKLTSKSKDPLESTQMNHVMLFKDQLIDELNLEVQKAQKEMCHFSIMSNSEGQYLRHKCNSTNSTGTTSSPCTTCSPYSPALCSGMELITINPSNDKSDILIENTASERKRVFLNSQINQNQTTMENINNLPDLAMDLSITGDESIYVNSSEDDFKSLSSSQGILFPDNTSLNERHLLMSEIESEEHQTLLLELQKCKENEMKWEQEKQKILMYQRQLQKKYIEVLKKTEALEEKFINQTNEP